MIKKEFYFGLNHRLKKLVYNELTINKRVFINNKLNNVFENRLENLLKEKDILFGNLMKRKLFDQKSFLTSLKNYKSIRHKKNLPCRGQRTKTNSRTVRKYAQKIS